MFEQLFRDRMMGRDRRNTQGTDRPLRGVILTGTEVLGQELFVFIPTIGENARRGPCRWEPVVFKGVTYTPAGGEDCIIQFDHRGLPWISNWTPDAGSHKL